MTKPEFTRPFNAEHARAGAPYCTSGGEEATILKWDCRHTTYNLAGVYGASDNPICWIENGKYFYLSNFDDGRDLVMTPLGMIDGKPVFTGDEVVINGASVHAYPFWGETCNWGAMSWPAPAKVYPETMMSGKELCQVYWDTSAGDLYDVFVDVANAVLRHAIDHGQVVVPDCAAMLATGNAYDRGRNDVRDEADRQRAARDLAIANAVLTDVHRALTGRGIVQDLAIDCAAIIAGVKA